MSKTYHTLKAWNMLGYKVKKGSRHKKRDKNGACLFEKDQVERSTKKRRSAYYNPRGQTIHIPRADLDYDDPMNWECPLNQH